MKKNREKIIKQVNIVKRTESGEFEDVSLEEHDSMPAEIKKVKSYVADRDPYFKRSETVTDLSFFKRPIPLDEEKVDSKCGCFGFRSKK